MTVEAARDQIQVIDDDVILNYVAGEEEVEEYAAYIGIDIELDRDLFWIAREGLRAAPPAPWKVCAAAGTVDVFYFNFITGESVWDHPCDDFFRQKVSDEIALRVLVPLTLDLQVSTSGYELRCINLAGHVACSADVADLDAVTFADVEQSLMAKLSLQGGAVPRFVLQDATIVSHSRRGETLGRLLKIGSEARETFATASFSETSSVDHSLSVPC
jgi:hypothetical protein